MAKLHQQEKENQSVQAQNDSIVQRIEVIDQYLSELMQERREMKVFIKEMGYRPQTK